MQGRLITVRPAIIHMEFNTTELKYMYSDGR